MKIMSKILSSELKFVELFLSRFLFLLFRVFFVFSVGLNIMLLFKMSLVLFSLSFFSVLVFFDIPFTITLNFSFLFNSFLV